MMPDIRFLEEVRDDLLGLVLTHGHEDHIGAVAHLWPRLRCPLYATPFTARLLNDKLEEAGLEERAKVKIVPLGGRIKLGPFEIDFISITHSIPEPNALAIRTPLGTILHTGDWKLDPEPLIGEATDEARLREVGDEGVLAIVCDSTNALKPGHSGSEGDLRHSLTELIGHYDGRVAVACFASNVARLSTIAHAARAHDRDVALVGRSLWRMDKAARENGYLADVPRFLTEDEAGYIPRDKILLICTGSQGEPRAALARIAREDHPNIVIEEGDVVIFSSRIIPGNEKAIGRLHNALIRLGIDIVTDEDHFVHVSGHPYQDELVRMYQMIRPQVAIPVHGEARHLLAHADLARQCQVPDALVIENGAMVRLDRAGATIVDEFAVGRIGSDGKSLLPIGGAVLQQRRRVGSDGSVVATLVVDRRGGLAAPPQISLVGLSEANTEPAAALCDALADAIGDLPAKFLDDDNQLREAARRVLRRGLNERFGKRPLIEIQLVRL
jgi:ribonuclease J